MPDKSIPNLKDVSETLLITLHTRAVESGRPNAMLKDDKAVAMVKQLNYDFSRIRIQPHDEVTIIMRMHEFDRFTRDFLTRHPEAVIVHIGCGLDTRFDRVDNGRVEWFDLDLPEVIELRRELLGMESERYHLISGSVFDDNWLDAVGPYRPCPLLFIAEGVMPYFDETRVKSLFRKLKDHFPGCEFVFDGISPFTIWADNLHLAFSRIDARMHWGLKNGKDIENWDADIHMLEEWYYFDRPEPRLNAFQWIRHIPFLAKSAGVFHYRVGSQP